MRNVRMAIWAVVVVLVATGVSKADLMGYIATETVVYSTNFDTGEQTALGPSGAPHIVAVDISPVDGSLYGMGDCGDELYQFNTSTGISTFKGEIDGSAIPNLSFGPDGTLYGISLVGNLVTIDLDTGKETLVDSLFPYIDIRAFAIDSSGNGIAWDAQAKWLCQIDLTHGSTTSIGQLDDPDGWIMAFDYAPDDTLYAWTINRSLYTVEADSLNATYVRSFSYGYHGVAIIPEPATLLLLGLGSLALLKKHRL